MNLHIIYATDKRPKAKKDERPAISTKGQLHDMEAPEKVDVADPNILYAATWDGISPWIVVLKGQISDLKMAYLGWPMVTQAKYEAQQPKGKT